MRCIPHDHGQYKNRRLTLRKEGWVLESYSQNDKDDTSMSKLRQVGMRFNCALLLVFVGTERFDGGPRNDNRE
jgi:hypothetical protein